tara:strand:+ start:499 stop:675 length:177 start_codon:yes stop_codon:yes gene_type:complete
MSKGILSHPIKPKTKEIEIMLGNKAIKEVLYDLKSNKNIINSKIITVPKVSICDLNKL